MSDNREYIKKRFESDDICAPESLSEDNMMKMLKAAESGESTEDAGISKPDASAEKTGKKHEWKERKPRRGTAKKLLKAVAVFMVAVIGISGARSLYYMAPDTSANGAELYSFKSKREIRNTVKSFDNSSPLDFLRLGSSEDIEEYYMDGGTGDVDMMAEEVSDAAGSSSSSAKSMTANSASGAETGSHSETYLQVENVDEADIVKTDGKYIYFVNSKKEVVIMSAKNGKTKKLSTIGSTGVENYISDIYLKGDTLVTVGDYYEEDDEEEQTGIVIYDISERSDPKMISAFSQSGDVVTSRMVGNYVYLVTNDHIGTYGRYMPRCGMMGENKDLPVSDISCVPEPHTSSYIVLSAIDISSGNQGKSATKAVFGATDDVYCNDHALYTASWEWSDDGNTSVTRIVRAKLDGLKVKFDATTTVKGTVDNQFSMDESGGYFRIATTSQRSGMDVNNLFVLDKDLKVAGKVTGFARNESIRAVRFMGNKAYVITYQAIDPLFIIDLSDPEEPRIEGEVKIDGFSSLLVPTKDGKLLGIGHATGDNGYGGEYASGLKLALFDISDPSEPKVLDSMEFNEMSSEAQYNHHALTVNTEEGWFAIPYEIWHYADIDYDDGDDVIIDEDAEYAEDSDVEEPSQEAETADQDYHEEGILLFGTSDKIGPVDKHQLKETSICRSVYIGNYIYAIGRDADVQSFKPEM